MPIRLMAALVVSILVPIAAECAAPFVESRQRPARVTSGAVDRDNGDYLLFRSDLPLRCQFMAPLALPIIDAGPKPRWVPPFEPTYPSDGRSYFDIYRSQAPKGLEVLTILHPPNVPSVALSSRRLNLHLDTAGVGRFGTAVVEVWITRDGWTWHLYQNAPHGDSLLVALPGEGRYGLRVVLHDVNGHPSPTPRVGEAPQLWVEIDESLPLVGTMQPPVARGEYIRYRKIDRRQIPESWKEYGTKKFPCEIRRIETEVAWFTGFRHSR